MYALGILTLLAGAPTASAAPDCGEAPCLEEMIALPRRPSLWERWNEATTRVMAGRRASALYRDTSNRMNVYWRLYEHDLEAPWLDESEAQRARDLAQIGALSGFELMMREAFERSEALGIVYRITSTANGANLEVKGDPNDSGRARLRYNSRSAQLRATEADLDEEPQPLRTSTRRAARRRVPSANTGVAFRLVDLAEDLEVVDPALAIVTYVDLRNLGVSAIRLQGMDTPPGTEPEGRGTWSAAARQDLLDKVSAFAKVRGQENRTWRPVRASTGISWQLPVRSRWYLRPELSHRLPFDIDLDAPDLDPVAAEWRFMLSLRAQWRWNLPNEASGWPLGAVVEPAHQ